MIFSVSDRNGSNWKRGIEFFFSIDNVHTFLYAYTSLCISLLYIKPCFLFKCSLRCRAYALQRSSYILISGLKEETLTHFPNKKNHVKSFDQAATTNPVAHNEQDVKTQPRFWLPKRGSLSSPLFVSSLSFFFFFAAKDEFQRFRRFNETGSC